MKMASRKFEKSFFESLDNIRLIENDFSYDDFTNPGIYYINASVTEEAGSPAKSYAYIIILNANGYDSGSRKIIQYVITGPVNIWCRVKSGYPATWKAWHIFQSSEAT